MAYPDPDGIRKMPGPDPLVLWDTTYMQARANGRSHEDAERMADAAVRETSAYTPT